MGSLRSLREMVFAIFAVSLPYSGSNIDPRVRWKLKLIAGGLDLTSHQTGQPCDGADSSQLMTNSSRRYDSSGSLRR